MSRRPVPPKRLLTNPQGLLLLRRRVGSHCRNTQTSGNNKIEAKQEKSGRQGGYIEAQSLPRGDFRGDQHAKRENERGFQSASLSVGSPIRADLH